MPTKSLRLVCALLAIFCFFNVLANAQQIRRGLYRGMPVTYTVKNGKAIFQGDVVLEKVDPIDPQRPLPSLGIDYAKYLWPKVGTQYQIPYVIASGSGDTTNLNAAITQFNNTFSNISESRFTSGKSAAGYQLISTFCVRAVGARKSTMPETRSPRFVGTQRKSVTRANRKKSFDNSTMRRHSSFSCPTRPRCRCRRRAVGPRPIRSRPRART